MDITTIKQIRIDMDAALAEIATKYGLALKNGRATYDSNGATFKDVAFVGVTKQGKALDKRRLALQALHPELEDKKFDHKGETYEIMGFNVDAPKYPFICETITGKTYRFPRSIVLSEA